MFFELMHASQLPISHWLRPHHMGSADSSGRDERRKLWSFLQSLTVLLVTTIIHIPSTSKLHSSYPKTENSHPHLECRTKWCSPSSDIALFIQKNPLVSQSESIISSPSPDSSMLLFMMAIVHFHNLSACFHFSMNMKTSVLLVFMDMQH